MRYPECDCVYCTTTTAWRVRTGEAYAATPTVVVLKAEPAHCTHEGWLRVGEHENTPRMAVDFGLRRKSDKERLQGKLARVLGAKGQHPKRRF
jgi:hypothetical protein